MSSIAVFNRVQEFFPDGLLLDTSGNCFNLFMEFPTVDGRMAGVLIWEEFVLVYNDNGKVLSKEEYFELSDKFVSDDSDDSEMFRSKQEILFSTDDIDYDDDDNRSLNPQPHQLFDTNTLIAIGRTWDKYNICLRRALRGE